MRRLFWHWAISAIALLLAVKAVGPVDITHWYHALWLAPLLGLVNTAVGGVSGIISFIAMPVNLLTLGCFGFVLSFILYWVAVYALGHVPSGPLAFAMPVQSFLGAAQLAILMGLFSTLLNMILPWKRQRRHDR